MYHECLVIKTQSLEVFSLPPLENQGGNGVFSFCGSSILLFLCKTWRPPKFQKNAFWNSLTGESNAGSFSFIFQGFCGIHHWNFSQGNGGLELFVWYLKHERLHKTNKTATFLLKNSSLVIGITTGGATDAMQRGPEAFRSPWRMKMITA